VMVEFVKGIIGGGREGLISPPKRMRAQHEGVRYQSWCSVRRFSRKPLVDIRTASTSAPAMIQIAIATATCGQPAGRKASPPSRDDIQFDMGFAKCGRAIPTAMRGGNDTKWSDS